VLPSTLHGVPQEWMCSPYAGRLLGRHVVSVGSVAREEVHHLLDVAARMRKVDEQSGVLDLARGAVLATLFFEASTRTHCSFAAAMLRLGGQVVDMPPPAQSSVSKGETLEDTVRCLACYAHVLVIRHPLIGSAARAARISPVPIINAGDGIGEHPTQAMLDLYTLHAEFGGRIDGLRVTLLGDLKHGRTVHSLIKLLVHFERIHVHLVSPAELSMPDDVINAVRAAGVRITVAQQLDSLQDTDVLYGQREQRTTTPDEDARPMRIGFPLSVITHHCIALCCCVCVCCLIVLCSDARAEGALCQCGGVRSSIECIHCQSSHVDTIACTLDTAHFASTAACQ
jgi:carbamoyl-phosphate synthase/aspartate carbamoyltransferase